MHEFLWLGVAMFVLLVGVPGVTYLGMLWLLRANRPGGDRPNPPESTGPERTVPGSHTNHRRPMA
jgi:hypothetical protein